MENYSIHLMSERDKTTLVNIVNRVGAHLIDIAGSGIGFLVSLEATPNQADTINLLFAGV